MNQADRPQRVRFAPPRDAQLLSWPEVRNGDWAYLAGYWWRVESLRSSEREGYTRCDLWRPNAEQLSVWVFTCSAFKRGGDNPYVLSVHITSPLGRAATAAVFSARDENGHLRAPGG